MIPKRPNATLIVLIRFQQILAINIIRECKNTHGLNGETMAKKCRDFGLRLTRQFWWNLKMGQKFIVHGDFFWKDVCKALEVNYNQMMMNTMEEYLEATEMHRYMNKGKTATPVDHLIPKSPSFESRANKNNNYINPKIKKKNEKQAIIDAANAERMQQAGPPDPRSPEFGDYA